MSGKVEFGLGRSPRSEGSGTQESKGRPPPFAFFSGTPIDLREEKKGSLNRSFSAQLARHRAHTSQEGAPRRPGSLKTPLTVEDGGRRKAGLENLQLLTCPRWPVPSHCPDTSREARSRLFHAWLRLGKRRSSLSELPRAAPGSAFFPGAWPSRRPRNCWKRHLVERRENRAGGRLYASSRQCSLLRPLWGAFACLERPRCPRGVFGWRASNPGRLAFRLSRERVQGEPNVRLALHQE